MLDREDMIELIEAFEAFERLNSMINKISGGYNIDDPDFDGLYNIYEVIKRNSRFPGEEDYDVETFRAIMFAINKTAEEKYDLIKTF